MRDSCETLDFNYPYTNTRMKHVELFDIIYDGSTKTNGGTVAVRTHNPETWLGQ